MPEQGFYKQQAIDFFKEWEVSYQALCDSFRKYFTDDCVWINMGFPATHGPEAAVKDGLDPVNAVGMDTIRVENLKVHEVGNIVWSERVDHVLRPDGSLGFSVPVVGVMEFTEDGLIKDWKEYFDHNHIVGFMGEAESTWLPEDENVEA